MTLTPNILSQSPTSYASKESACPQPMDEGSKFVECQVCGKRFVVITRTHLKSHGLTFANYKRLFPNAPLMTAELLRKHSERLRRQASEASKKSWLNRERKIEAIKRGRAKRIEIKACVDCGKEFVATEPWQQKRCPKCQRLFENFVSRQRYYRIKRYIMEDFKELNELETNLPETHYPCLFGAGTIGTPAMNLTVLSNGRIAGALWLESSGKKFNYVTIPKTPWRRRLLESGWQKQILQECPDCGERSLLTFVENPHCMECGSEIVFAKENECYTISEFVCSKCGLVDDGIHYIFKCPKCSTEFRVCVGQDGGLEFRRVI